MRTTIQNVMKARRAERGEDPEGGFSLIELIIVVVILGILVAIAIPIFASIQERAAQSAVDAAAANGATAVAAALADPASGISVTDAAKSGGTPGKIDVTPVSGKNTSVTTVCVQATDHATTPHTATAGPGC